MLKIFNTLSRQKEEFKPIHAGKVGMYVCGITIYDLCHIGHGRTFVAFDVVARYLRYLGYSLTYVRNVTDVDDKIIKRAIENNETCEQLTTRMLAEMHKDFDALNLERPDLEPRATHHIAEIIEMTERLIARGHAYVASNGDVMFAVDSDPDYGVLSDRIWINYRPVHGLKWLMLNVIRWISCCGKCPNRVSHAGNHLGGRAALVGILNVQQ